MFSLRFYFFNISLTIHNLNVLKVQKKYALKEVYQSLEEKQVALQSYYLSSAMAMGHQEVLLPVSEVMYFILKGPGNVFCRRNHPFVLCLSKRQWKAIVS